MDLIRVIHAASPIVYFFNTVHDLRIALHILRLLLRDHDGVDQMEVHQANHFILRWLIKCMLDVPAFSNGGLAPKSSHKPEDTTLLLQIPMSLAAVAFSGS